ncbi:MAG: BolA family transcriptional regulator [Proteobacteria bacterium]|nr:BolA family transcriptional regulator [Pseudomonadota bacterium]
MTHPGRLSVEATLEAIRTQVNAAIPGCDLAVRGGGGHYEITVTSDRFDGLNRVKRQRLVYSSIKDLMAGHDAPVHAVDRLITRTLAEAK